MTAVAEALRCSSLRLLGLFSIYVQYVFANEKPQGAENSLFQCLSQAGQIQ